MEEKNECRREIKKNVKQSFLTPIPANMFNIYFTVKSGSEWKLMFFKVIVSNVWISINWVHLL